jgi:hypothetical protein
MVEMENRTHKSLSFHRALDFFGASASFLCAIHCLAMPLLLTLLPAIGLSFLLNENIEKAFVIGTVALASLNSCWGYRLHKKSRVFIFILIGSALLLIATFAMDHQHLHHSHDHHGHDHGPVRPQDNFWGLSMMVCGAITLAIGHLLNRSFCNKCIAHVHSNECKH